MTTNPAHSAIVTAEGHLVDSQLLKHIFDRVIERGGEFDHAAGDGLVAGGLLVGELDALVGPHRLEERTGIELLGGGRGRRGKILIDPTDLARFLEENLLPGLSQEVVTSRLVTPQDFQDRLLSYQGAGFALEPVLTQSAWFRAHNRDDVIPNLYLVGAGTHPGAGIPQVLAGAKVTAGLMLQGGI